MLESVSSLAIVDLQASLGNTMRGRAKLVFKDEGRTVKERVIIMKKCGILYIILMIGACFCGLNQLIAQEKDGSYAYVLDRKMKVVQKISFSSESLLDSHKMEIEPSYMMLTPNKSKLIVFDSCKKEGGRTNRKNDPRYEKPNLYRCKNPNTIRILDAGNLELLAKIDNVGFNLVAHQVIQRSYGQHDLGETIDAFWDGSGNILTALAWGKKGKPAEIIQLDVEKGQINGRLPLKTETWFVGGFTKLSDDTAALYSSWRWTDKAKTAMEHTLWIVDLKDLTKSKEMTLPGRPRFLWAAPNKQTAYELADYAGMDTKTAQAHLHILSVDRRSVIKNINEGRSFADVWVDPKSGLSYITRFDDSQYSTLCVFDGEIKKAEVKIPDIALGIVAASLKKKLHIICADSVQIINSETFELVGGISTPRRNRGFWEKGEKNRLPSGLALNSDESIGVLGYSGDDEFSVLDLDALKVRGIIDLESGLKSFGKTLGKAAAAGALGYVGDFRSMSSTTGYLIDPSDKQVHILRGGDLYSVDLDTYRVVGKRDIGLYGLYIYVSSNDSGREHLYVVNPLNYYQVAILDINTMEKAVEQKWRGPIQQSSDGKYAVSHDKESVYLLDGPHFKTERTISGFKDVRQVIVVW